MGCCSKTIKKVKHIVKGYTALAVGKKYEFTDIMKIIILAFLILINYNKACADRVAPEKMAHPESSFCTLIISGTITGNSMMPNAKQLQLTGQRFGRLLVLRKVGQNKHKSNLWECQCDCGIIKNIPTGSLVSGNTQSCGCIRILQLVGQRFGKLIVIERVGKNKQGNYCWKCSCDCGNETVVSGSHLRKNAIKSCGCGHIFPNKEGVFNDLLRIYKRNARTRKLSFELTKEEFRKLVNGDCYYCGVEPSQTHYSRRRHSKYIYNGIDRVDNNKGYLTENCISCCGLCNYMRRNKTQKEFCSHISKIYKHLVL